MSDAAAKPAKETVVFSPEALAQMRRVAASEGISMVKLVERALSLYYLEREVKARGGKLLIEEPGGGLKEIGEPKPPPAEVPAQEGTPTS